MATTIIQRTIGGSPEKAIQLNNSQFGRPISLPSGWGKIRVGLRCHCTDPGAGVNSVGWFVGVGHGTTNMIGSASCDHWAGVAISAGDLWSRNATMMFGVATQGAKKVGAVLTYSVGQIGAAFAIANGAALAAADRNVWLVDITKGSPNYTFNMMAITVAPSDFTSAYFLTQMNLSVPAFTNNGFGGDQTVAVDESVDGTFDAVQIYWNRADFLMEICDLAVAVLS